MIKFIIIFITILLFIIFPLNYKINTSLIINKNIIEKDLFQYIYVHRVNNIDLALEINSKFNTKKIYAKNIIFGIETDLNFHNEKVVVSHNPLINNTIDIKKFLEKTPKNIPIFFDLKDSINNIEAIKVLKELDVLDRHIVFASFNIEIIKKLNQYKISKTCFLSWLLVPNQSNYKWIIFEYYARILNFFGGTIQNPFQVDYIAYNWKSMKHLNSINLKFKNHRIAGSVDSKEAFNSVKPNSYSFLTDNPDKIYKWILDN